MSIDVKTSSTLLCSGNLVEVHPPTNVRLKKDSDVQVEGNKKEYSIIGDAMYTTYSSNPPPWLTELVDVVLTNELKSSMEGLNDLRAGLLSAIDKIEVAENTYTSSISGFRNDLLSAQARLDTMNSTLNQNTATIVELGTTVVTKDNAAAIVGQVISSSINEGQIGSNIQHLQTSISNLDTALSDTVTLLNAAYEGVSNAQSELENTVAANYDKAMANFAYNASLKLKFNGVDYYYNSGFGIKTTLEGGPTAIAPSGHSEFWINADVLRFTSTSASGRSYTPFLVDGPAGVVRLTGEVAIDGSITEVKNIYAENIIADNVTVNWRILSSNKGATNKSVLEQDMVNGTIIIRDLAGNTRVRIGMI